LLANAGYHSLLRCLIQCLRQQAGSYRSDTGRHLAMSASRLTPAVQNEAGPTMIISPGQPRAQLTGRLFATNRIIHSATAVPWWSSSRLAMPLP
jgi:hypothetical protein